jgi:hypothetical protein
MDPRNVVRTVLALVMAAFVPELSATTVGFYFGGQSCLAQVCTARPTATTITFDDLLANTPSAYTEGLATYSWQATNSPFVQGNVGGEWAAPYEDSTTFLTIGSIDRPGTVTISFSKPLQYFGLYMGSPDVYNHISFYDTAGLIGSFTGKELINPGNGDQTIADYLNFFAYGGTITQIVMSSTSAAFETDSHSYEAVPEPGTLGALGLGLAIAALMARRRRLLTGQSEQPRSRVRSCSAATAPIQ